MLTPSPPKISLFTSYPSLVASARMVWWTSSVNYGVRDSIIIFSLQLEEGLRIVANGVDLRGLIVKIILCTVPQPPSSPRSSKVRQDGRHDGSDNRDNRRAPKRRKSRGASSLW